MNLKEALKLFIEGKKIRKIGWSLNQYIYWNESEEVVCDEEDCEVGIYHCKDDEWEKYKEVKKVKMAPCVHKSGGLLNKLEICDRLFSNEKEAREFFNTLFVKWLGGTSYEVEIEIEEPKKGE